MDGSGKFSYTFFTGFLFSYLVTNGLGRDRDLSRSFVKASDSVNWKGCESNLSIKSVWSWERFLNQFTHVTWQQNVLKLALCWFRLFMFTPTPVSFHLCTVKYFSRALSVHNNLHNNSGVIWLKVFFTLFSLKSPRIVTRASSPWHKRANLLPDIYFSDTRFRSVVLFSSAGGEQRTKAPTTLHRVIDYRQKFFFFVRCHFESAFSFLSGEITEFMRLISQTALIIVGAHGSASQIFFNLSQSTKDDTWDVMRGDRRVEFEVSDVIPIKAHVP